MSERIQLWSCGGGRQSAGIAALISMGELPKPDHVCMVALEWEIRTVWPYVNQYIRPAVEALGISFTAIPRAKYATKDFFGGELGVTPLIPAYTNQSGKVSKLNEWCSGEWKRDVAIRWAAEQEDWKARGVVNWIGISTNERGRVRQPRRQWFQLRYPLITDRPTHVLGCLLAVEKMGWPQPPRSRCRHCPNQSDSEWAELTPEEWELACQTDEYVRSIDPHAFLHKQCIPLRQVVLNVADDNGGLFGGCTSGMCY
jgi:hypothetical protein